MRPVSSAAIGLCFAAVAWASVVAVDVPIWMRVALDRPRSIPFAHLESPVALVGFGLVLGAGYPLVRRLLTPPADRTGS